MVEYHGESKSLTMHKVYRLNSGIEFQVGVKQKVLIVMMLIGLVIVATHIDLILEYMIAGF